MDFCLRLNEILGVGKHLWALARVEGAITALGGRDSGDRQPGVRLHRCGRRRLRAVCRWNGGLMMLQRVRAGTAWMASWTCPRSVLC